MVVRLGDYSAVVVDWSDPDTREHLARACYYRDRADDVAVDQEHELAEEVSYWCLQWESLSTASQRPYRTAVVHLCEMFEEVSA